MESERYEKRSSDFTSSSRLDVKQMSSVPIKAMYITKNARNFMLRNRA